MNAVRKFGSIGTLILSLFLVAAPSWAQKSLSDGVDELAAKLAKSYGDGKRGKVAIVPLRELGGGENLLGTYIADTLTNSFFEVGYRDIVERQMLDRAIQELKLSLTGMIDADSAKKIGKFLHADLVVGGTMTDLTGEVSVNCRIFSVETGQVVAVGTTKIVKDDNVKSMMAKGSVTAGSRSSEGSQGKERQDAMRDSGAEGKDFHKRLAPFDITLQKCEHARGSLSCNFLVKNTSAEPANLALGSRDTVVFADGSECSLREASLGSRRWSAEQFGAIRVESNIPLIAQLQFAAVPSTSRLGSLRFVIAVVPTGGPQAFFGPNPEWQSLVFKDVPFQ